MSDKKKKPGINLVSSLVPFEFREAELTEHFPNVTGDYYGFVVFDQEPLAYLCAEPLGSALNLHIWIPKGKRSKENILRLKEILWNEVKPWGNSEGFDTFLASCPDDNFKTKALLETFGFNLTRIWVGVLGEEE